ncbi:hypothetical protein PENTCL1PPCAC_8874 [Pristionchus entomophagus]|uniref:G protein-coupled receptor n=1 Tax=Pristionchus entomophagus TaxID=358040 RepID=A0AAV5SZF3_9BILA|nr:hypothetical protein PENTCL1PPCAC_8874 [Pristionchus entomophagus]
MQPDVMQLRGNMTYIGNINVMFVPNDVETYDNIFVVYICIHHIILAGTMLCYAIIFRAVRQSAANSGGQKLDNFPHSLRFSCYVSRFDRTIQV